MRNLVLMAFGLYLSSGLAQAQYQDLVEAKLGHLQLMEIKVSALSDLPTPDKTWALGQIAESQAVLNEMREATLEDLQAAEQAINATCAEIAERVMLAKKAKLIAKIAHVDEMILWYQNEGLDTSELEALSDSMKVQVEGL